MLMHSAVPSAFYVFRSVARWLIVMSFYFIDCCDCYRFISRRHIAVGSDNTKIIFGVNALFTSLASSLFDLHTVHLIHGLSFIEDRVSNCDIKFK